VSAAAIPTPERIDANPRPDRLYWREAVARHERPSLPHSLLDLATSVVPYLALCAAMYFSLGISVWITFALAIPAAGFLLRTFIVFHDCAHGSFLPSRRANLWVGRVTGLLVFQPFANWRHNHAVHHGSSGDLDRRGTGDIATLTVEEYLSRPWKSRLGYRLFRNPVVMFGIGPIWSLMIGPRIWSNKMRPRQRRSILATNLVLALLIAAISWLVGLQAWLLVQIPTAVLAGTLGVFMFYVQHQFEDVYWRARISGATPMPPYREAPT
jgi:acyl-lipid omega-6 desaturase (Delta-12 desaturase)